VELEHHEHDGGRWQVARRLPAPALQPLLGQALEGWAWEGRSAASFRELPFPGIPLILNLDAPWRVEGARLDSFLAGLHTRPTTVAGDRVFSCLELRLTPLGARRLLGRRPLHEVTDRSLPLEELLPGTQTLLARLRDVSGWEERFDCVESFLIRRLAESDPPPRELEWAWRQLVRSGGRVRVRTLARELDWSPRRLIDRFRDHIGLPPKGVARVIRFDRAVAALRSGQPRIAEVAAACGYADQAHLARDFRALSGITPAQLVAGNFVQDAAGAPA
jgi:AraC-like DNA-binding protein